MCSFLWVFSQEKPIRGQASRTHLAPFFRESPSDSEFIPPKPVLTPFDKDILDVCGYWGTYPKRSDFRALLDKPEHKDLIGRFYNELNHQVITANADLKLFKDELTNIWFTSVKSKKSKSSSEISTGFRHVFCGEPMKKTLGGMHFVGRYLQAQNNGWAGALWGDKILCDQLEISHPVYTFGIRFRNNRGSFSVKCPNGYAYDFHADNILTRATKAFKQLGESGMCLYNVDGKYQAVFIRTSKGIHTFYPDLNPNCNRRNIDCRCDKNIYILK